MIFKLSITCDNAAFEDAPGDELARILRRLADRLESGAPASQFAARFDAVSLHDVNGNKVGFVRIMDPEPSED